MHPESRGEVAGAAAHIHHGLPGELAMPGDLGYRILGQAGVEDVRLRLFEEEQPEQAN